MALYQVENLTYYYPDTSEPALADLNLVIEEGQFVFLAGKSGCGKSTLLRALAGLLPDYYGGKIGGEIKYAGHSLQHWDKRQLAREVGIVMQNPEQQLVMTVVEQELAFGLENLGIPRREMRQRVAEVLALLDLSEVKGEATFILSGGQKQKVILGAVLVMQPRVLLLDEPTSQLDPAAAQEFLQYIQRLNQEWGLTVVIVEQRAERCFHLADRVVLLADGRIVEQAPPRELKLQEMDKYHCFLPPVTRVFASVNYPELPLTLKEGREVLKRFHLPLPKTEEKPTGLPENVGEPVLTIKKVDFAYPNGHHCLKGINLDFYPGQLTVILGENGAGKSTLLKNINGLLKPQRGKIYLHNKEITGEKPERLALDIGYLSQNPADYLFNDTVALELAFGLQVRNMEYKERVVEVLELLDLSSFASVNPRDLSGGERQRVALGAVLAPDPPVLLLDEPTRGLDPDWKQNLGQLLAFLQQQGKCIVLVTHDIEFAAQIAQRVVIMSAGEIIATGSKEDILANSLYYSPQVNRLFKGINASIMTIEDAISQLQLLYTEAG